jgi:uncharacterized membrane protein YphA (DoxX/SURF4 family)
MKKTFLSLILLVVRVYVGYQWLHAGITKIINPNWVGTRAGES